MKHVLTLTIAMIGCSEPAQRSAFDPQSTAERASAQPEHTVIRSGDASASHELVEDPVEGSVGEAVEDFSIPDEPVALGGGATYSTVTVRSGESLDRLSRWSGASVEELAALNELEITSPLIPGQVMEIPIADQEAFDASRNGELEKRLERYLASNGGLAGIEGYTVRTGDTAWAIAKQIASVPSWVLAAFNPDRSLDHLSVGDTLYLPIMTQVADNEEPMDDLSIEVLAEAPDESTTDQP